MVGNASLYLQSLGHEILVEPVVILYYMHGCGARGAEMDFRNAVL